MTTDTIPEAQACCAHCKVVLKHHEHPKGLRSDYWECADCGCRFIQASVMDTEVTYRADAIATLQKQCEALETALADWHKLADQRSEALVKAQLDCDAWRVVAEAREKEIFRHIARAEKAEAEVAELSKQFGTCSICGKVAWRTDKNDATLEHCQFCELNNQLTKLQQDVRPLMESLQHWCAPPSYVESALETFLAKHPELKP